MSFLFRHKRVATVFKAHKFILAAGSEYFANVFETTPINTPCIVILETMSNKNMSALLEFMYKGEVNVSKEGLYSFLETAKYLKVRLICYLCP